MFKKPTYSPSTSFVLEKVPKGFTREDVEAMFKDFLPLENVVFHYLSPELFTNRVTIVFPNMEIATKAAARFLGKHIGEHDLNFYYSAKTFNLALTHDIGEISMRSQQDDPDVTSNPFAPNNFVRDWCKLEQVPEISIRVDYVSLRFNRLAMFTGTFDSLVTLNIKGNNIKSITGYMPRLNKLIASHNLLQELPDFSSISPKIEFIDVSFNQIVKVTNELECLTELKELDISHNQIQHLPKLPPKLNRLIAHCNNISESENTDIHLQSITFWKNNFTEIPQYAQGLVDTLTFSFNKLDSFNPSCLLQGITELNLCHNSLTDLPDSIFQIRRLTSLILFDNQLTSIPDEFSKSRLEILDISENPISSLPQIPYNLTTLKINFCEFEDLEHCIDEYNQLEVLHAIGNHLTFLPQLPAVTELLVCGNDLVSIPYIARDFLTKVTFDASHNKLKNTPPHSAPFRLLDLSFNEIDNLPDSFFLFKSSLVLCGNPINRTITGSTLSKMISFDAYRSTLVVTGPLPESVKDSISAFEGKETENPSILLFECDDKVGYSDMIGKRPEMEDAMIIRQHFGNQDHSLFGIFDGHSGRQTARFAAAAFPANLSKYETVTADIMEEEVAKFQNTLVDMNERSGSTMDLAYVDHEKKHVTVAHLGDSKVIVVTNDGRVTHETIEMKPEYRPELERLRDEKIMLRRMRTGGMLAMSGSIGDTQCPGVRHNPEFYEWDLNEDDRWIVLACDGIWDDISSEDCAKTLQRARNPHEASALLRDQAYSRGSEDNISVIVFDMSS